MCQGSLSRVVPEVGSLFVIILSFYNQLCHHRWDSWVVKRSVILFHKNIASAHVELWRVSSRVGMQAWNTCGGSNELLHD